MRQRQLGQRLAADLGGGEVHGEARRGCAGEDGVQQRRPDRSAQLLADGGGRLPRVLRADAERTGIDRRRDHHAHPDCDQNERAEQPVHVPGMRA